MPESPSEFPFWLTAWMQTKNIVLWGAADLHGFSTPLDDTGEGFPFAVSFGIPMPFRIMAEIRNGPTQAYSDEYGNVNHLINELSQMLTHEIRNRGRRAQMLAASERTDTVNIKGAFPHKTAATLAGLGWIGRHCQLITRKFGPWVRLGTVFTDMELPCGPPVTHSFCGCCTSCVDACPVGALTGKPWKPGLPREEMLDVRACDHWKRKSYPHFQKGRVCGICTSVCLYGLKAAKKRC